MGSYNYGVKSSYLKSKIGGIITDFKSKFLIVAISTVSCSLLQVFSEGEIPEQITESDRFYKITLSDEQICYVDCSNVINKNLEDIVFWLSNYPSSLMAHIDLDELDGILISLKRSSSIPNKVLKTMC